VLEVKWRDKTSKKTHVQESKLSEPVPVGLADLGSRLARFPLSSPTPHNDQLDPWSHLDNLADIPAGN